MNKWRIPIFAYNLGFIIRSLTLLFVVTSAMNIRGSPNGNYSALSLSYNLPMVISGLMVIVSLNETVTSAKAKFVDL